MECYSTDADMILVVARLVSILARRDRTSFVRDGRWTAALFKNYSTFSANQPISAATWDALKALM
jgi:hypothetical protein